MITTQLFSTNIHRLSIKKYINLKRRYIIFKFKSSLRSLSK